MRKVLDLVIRNNFPDLIPKKTGAFRNRLRAFKIFKTPPVGHPNEIISYILTAIFGSVVVEAGLGVTVAGVTVGLTYAGIVGVVVYGAVIGLYIWSYMGQRGKGVGEMAISNNGQLVNTRQSSQPIRVVYGVARRGANVFFSRHFMGK
jgi:hypothetical protein